MYIPDPCELIEMAADRIQDTIETVNGVEMLPCMECKKVFPLSEAESTSQFGTFVVCPDCFDKWLDELKEAKNVCD